MKNDVVDLVGELLIGEKRPWSGRVVHSVAGTGSTLHLTDKLPELVEEAKRLRDEVEVLRAAITFSIAPNNWPGVSISNEAWMTLTKALGNR